MHNGVFKSLEEVVHFYNTRNIAVNAAGQQVAFDLRNGPPAGYTPLFPPPEVLDNVQNVAGLTPAQAAAMGVSGVAATNGQVGNLGLTASAGGRPRQLPQDPHRRLRPNQPRQLPVRSADNPIGVGPGHGLIPESRPLDRTQRRMMRPAHPCSSTAATIRGNPFSQGTHTIMIRSYPASASSSASP